MDRAVRFVIGILLLYLTFTTDNNLLIIVFTAFATISIYESYIGFCGIYKLFKINTIGSK
ncbi:MAG: DUF2892 domain-containing protein [Nanoarchaeota archaeon]